jgi:nitroreductase
MDIMEALHSRVSVPAKLLTDPAPEGDDLNAILRAAVTAPDHAGLQPWKFVLIRGDARRRFGDLLAECFKNREKDPDEAKVERQRTKPLRSPLIIVVVARIQPDHPKVPKIEQILSAGCAAEHMQLAARTLGYGSVWLTGAGAYDWNVNEALGLDLDDQIVGFLYIGTPPSPLPPPKRPDPEAFVTEWQEPQKLSTL